MKPLLRLAAPPEAPPGTDVQAYADSVPLRRATHTGILGCYAGIVISGFAAWLDAKWALRSMVWVDLLFVAGCGVSLYLSFRLHRYRYCVWEPAYFTLWVNSLVVIGSTGGAASPFFAAFQALLTISLGTVQTRFGVRAILVFFLCNYVGWTGASALFLHGPAYEVSDPIYLAFRKSTLLVGAVVCFLAYVRAEEKLIAEGRAKSAELAETQRTLTHAARMAEIGNLMATTAHEISQPIQAMVNAAGVLERLIGQDQANRERFVPILRLIWSSSERALRLSSNLRNFSRKEDWRPVEFDLRDVVRTVLELAENDLVAHGVRVEFERWDEPLRIHADPHAMEQVILNLINNARDASLQSPDPRILIRTKRERGWVRLLIENSGPPIPLESQGRVFEAYFTTKSQGTGLGLSICLALVEKLRGRIFFCSGDEGTRFVVDLPAAKAAPAARAPGLGAVGG